MIAKEIRSSGRLLAGLFTSVVMIGCGGGADLPLGQVEGTILLDGAPLPNAIVEFQPAGSTGAGRPSVGETGPDGKYKLRFAKNQWGAVVGQHKVRITTFSPDGDGGFRERVPAAYNSHSNLVRDVQGQGNWIDFDLQSAATTGSSLAAGE
jgi:hypothetical protein